MNAIEVEELCFSYQATRVLDRVSFSVAEGEFTCIFGPNGGGKTTLLYLLMGFLKPFRGSIKIFGEDPKAARKKIGWVPQNFHFDPDFPISVKEVVLGGRIGKTPWHGRFSAEDERVAREALEEVGLSKLINKPFSEASGGQAQRILIARALASHPSLLLLDEPTSSIDLEAQNEIYATLKKLKGTMTIVMVSHDLKVAVDQVDRLFCVKGDLTTMSPRQVCEHFALGLYHPPTETAS